MVKNDKILVACLAMKSSEFCIDQFIEHTNKLDNKICDLLFVTDSKDLEKKLSKKGTVIVHENTYDHLIKWRVESRKIMQKAVVNSDYSHVLFTELNVMLPKDILEKLVGHRKDLITGIYLTSMKFDGKLEILPTTFGQADDGVRLMEVREILNDSLIEVSAAGLGCCLVSRELLEKTNFRYFENTNTGDDISFFIDSKEKGYQAFADCSQKCTYLVSSDKENWNKFFDFDAYPPIRNPKVLIGCVTHDKDEPYLEKFLESVRGQDYKNTDILFVDTSESEEYVPKLKGTGAIVVRDNSKHDHNIKKITSGRNKIREYALKNNYDYVLFVDTDVMPPSHALSKMLSNRKDVCAGVCLINSNLKGNVRIIPNTYDFDDEEGFCRPMVVNDVLNDKIVEVSCAGFGCTMVSRKALEATEFRYYEKSMAGEDIAFFVDTREKGFKTFADNSVKCSHMVFLPGDPRNRKFRFETYEEGMNYSTVVSDVE